MKDKRVYELGDFQVFFEQADAHTEVGDDLCHEVPEKVDSKLDCAAMIDRWFNLNQLFQ